VPCSLQEGNRHFTLRKAHLDILVPYAITALLAGLGKEGKERSYSSVISSWADCQRQKLGFLSKGREDSAIHLDGKVFVLRSGRAE
jgi:hypothetical protein